MFPLEMLGVTVAPYGTSETETVSGLPSVSLALPTVATVAVGLPRTTVMLPVILSVGAVLVEVIVRFASEMSKKMLPTASTLMRPCVVATFAVFGIVTRALPLFGTLLARTIGKVWPPSVESEIFTLAQFIGAAVELATFHATVWSEPPAIVAAAFGAVIAKGPAVATDVTVVDP